MGEVSQGLRLSGLRHKAFVDGSVFKGSGLSSNP